MAPPKEPMKPREWILLIVLLMVIQFCVLELSYKFDTDTELLSHISLAGTIVGIILAVIAIIFGFFQQAAQQTSSENIAIQVHSLKEVATDLDVSGGAFTAKLQAIDGIALRLANVATKVNAIEVNVEETMLGGKQIAAKIEGLFDRLSTKTPEMRTESATDAAAATSPQSAQQLLRGMPSVPNLTVLTMALTHPASRTADDLKEAIGRGNQLASGLTEKVYELVAPLFDGYIRGTLGVLLATGHVTIDKALGYTLSSDLAAAAAQVISPPDEPGALTVESLLNDAGQKTFAELKKTGGLAPRIPDLKPAEPATA